MQLSTELSNDTWIKLERRAERLGLTAAEAARVIAVKGAEFFLAMLVGATNSSIKG
jgi:hypothetical protein